MSATAILLSALAVAVPATAETVAATPPAAIAYVGVAEDAVPEQVAMVSWGEDAGAMATVVKSLYKQDEAGRRVTTREFRAAAVQPGKYELSMMCAVSGNPVFLVFETEFVAGKRYRVACEGRNGRSVKVVSTEI
jgi:hypothetical protein